MVSARLGEWIEPGSQVTFIYHQGKTFYPFLNWGNQLPFIQAWAVGFNHTSASRAPWAHRWLDNTELGPCETNTYGYVSRHNCLKLYKMCSPFNLCACKCTPHISTLTKARSIGEDGIFSGEGLDLNFPLGGGAIFQPKGELGGLSHKILLCKC